MKMIKKLVLSTSLLFFVVSCNEDNSRPQHNSTNKQNFEFTHAIPAGENSWISGTSGNSSGTISKEGIQDWTDSGSKITSYFRTSGEGELHLGLEVRASSGPSTLKITFADQTKEIRIENSEYENLEIGSFTVQEGYHSIVIEPIEKTGSTIAEIKTILVGGPAADQGINYVEDNFHFGRRGPSVHLRYEYPEEKDVLYFYNEIEVPEGEDVIGSYFMANGFTDGYFGIQVNSEDERRILFSVWSPYDTQDPNDIPEDYRITLLKKGEEVYAGKFGNEGSGGQSYKKFMWRTGTTYKFLLKGEPAGNNHTDYTAYFFAPEIGEWELIASFRRPYTDNYLGNLYSFLENFSPSTGDTTRKGLYKNQWVYDTQGNWIESTKARFTADATANAGHRLDFAGGVEGDSYFMKNCGFFNEYTEMKTVFEREPGNDQPMIDFALLP